MTIVAFLLNSVFPGLVHQLSLAGEASTVSELRQQTSAEMRANTDQYLPFLSLSPPQFEVGHKQTYTVKHRLHVWS